MLTNKAVNANLRSKSGKLRPINGGSRSKTVAMKDKPRGGNGGGSPKNMDLMMQMRDRPRPPKSSGSTKTIDPPEVLQPEDQPRPPRGGGSPKIAAVLNWYGNDCIRQAAQKPEQKGALIETAMLCYLQALEQDPQDPGLMINLAMANLLQSKALDAESQFVNAFEKSQKDFHKLFALLSLKYDHDKFAEKTPLSVAEKALRTTIKKCIEKGDKTSKAANQPALRENLPTETPVITPAEAREFLYIKTIDNEKR